MSKLDRQEHRSYVVSPGRRDTGVLSWAQNPGMQSMAGQAPDSITRPSDSFADRGLVVESIN